MVKAASGRAHGAVGVLNAIGSGYGAAVAVGLWVEARLWRCRESMVESVTRGVRLVVEPRIVEAVASVAAEEAGAGLEGLCGTVASEVPLEAGLKGSSALVNAMLEAALRLLGVDPEGLGVEGLARLGVEAAWRAGLTVTGALDDHLSTLGCGLYLTRNPDTLLLHDPLEALGGHVAVAAVPGRRSIRSVSPQSFQRLRGVFLQAYRLLSRLPEAGVEALTAASLVNAAAVLEATGGGSLEPLAAALEAGAVFAGVSGKGPAYYAVAPPERVETVKKALREKLPGAELVEARLLACRGPREIP